MKLSKKKIFQTIIGLISAIFLYQFKSDNPKLSNKIYYTKHALCRMNCRTIDKSEIDQAIKKGKINNRKSEPNARPCPKVAYEYRVKPDNQLVRIITANCQKETKIITVIDLENSYNCKCR